MRQALVRTLAMAPGGLGRRARYASALAALESGAAAPGLDRLVRSLVSEAERALRSGRDARAVPALVKALTLALHPARSTGADAPGLLRDPATVLAAFDGGLVAEVLGRAGTASAHGAAAVGPASRILVISGGGLSFLRGVIGTWQAAGARVETLQVRDLPAAARPGLGTVVEAAVTAWRRGVPLQPPEALREHLEGVDHVHVEWGDEVAAWISRMDLGTASLSVRIHKYEILTPYPHLLDASRVDTLCFVAPHVRDAALAIAPRLSAAGRLDVTQNALDVDRFADATPARDLPDDLPGRDHVLGLIGWAGPAKDADWALDVLEALRARTPASEQPWTLLLVGPEPEARGADADRVRRLLARIAASGDRVRMLGRREDVPSVLQGIGWVISASLIEGTHEAVAEGAAAGCVPVVRDWPQVRAQGGARTVYPESWLVQDPDAAARRILAAVPDRESRGREAATWIRADRDPDRLAAAQAAWTVPPYDRELGGDAPRREGGTA